MISQTDLFPACLAELHDALVPLHYKELTRRGLRRLRCDVNVYEFQRLAEDVREKYIGLGRDGTFYTGKPLALAGLREWFRSEQLPLLHIDYRRIAGSATAGVAGAYECLMRSPYMLNKTTSRMRAQGLVIEKHVAEWFRERWPSLYLEPENHERWATPCRNDFRLKFGGKMYGVDVSGPRMDGTYGNPGNGKKTTDLHLICQLVDHDVLWMAVVPRERFVADVIPEQEITPTRLIVRLNCEQDGINYAAVHAAAAPVLNSVHA